MYCQYVWVWGNSCDNPPSRLKPASRHLALRIRHAAREQYVGSHGVLPQRNNGARKEGFNAPQPAHLPNQAKTLKRWHRFILQVELLMLIPRYDACPWAQPMAKPGHGTTWFQNKHYFVSPLDRTFVLLKYSLQFCDELRMNVIHLSEVKTRSWAKLFGSSLTTLCCFLLDPRPRRINWSTVNQGHMYYSKQNELIITVTSLSV